MVTERLDPVRYFHFPPSEVQIADCEPMFQEIQSHPIRNIVLAEKLSLGGECPHLPSAARHGGASA